MKVNCLSVSVSLTKLVYEFYLTQMRRPILFFLSITFPSTFFLGHPSHVCGNEERLDGYCVYLLEI